MKNEPVVGAAAISGVIVALASIFNVVLDLNAVQTAITAVLPIVLALLARDKVTPLG